MKNIKALRYIGFLGGCYAYIKNCHWSAKNMSEHKLCDDLASLVSSTQDEIAEVIQGIDGKFNVNDVKAQRINNKTTNEVISLLLRNTKTFHSACKSKTYIGVQSVLEDFIGQLNKYQYLLKLCLKEDFIRRFKGNTLNENKMHEGVTYSKSDIRNIITETINTLMCEAFQSSQIRDWAKQHNGIKKVWEGDGKTLIYQGGLSEITDDMIGYFEEFSSRNEAANARFKLAKPNHHNQRNELDMKYEFNIFEANDGTSILVGTYRSMGSPSAKTDDRKRQNGWSHKLRDNRYADDSDSYYYGGGNPTILNDFGLHTNHNYQYMANDLQKQRDRFHQAYGKDKGEEAYKQSRQDALKRKNDYLRKHQ